MVCFIYHKYEHLVQNFWRIWAIQIHSNQENPACKNLSQRRKCKEEARVFLWEYANCIIKLKKSKLNYKRSILIEEDWKPKRGNFTGKLHSKRGNLKGKLHLIITN